MISMPAWRETSRKAALIGAAAATGFALTIHVFYPGVMTYDAGYVYQYVAEGFFGDWQSPVMTALWSLIDPLAPGPASMLLLTAALYWSAFGLLALIVARRSLWLGLLLLALGLSPPAFVFVGIIWRDVLFAVVWLLAAALAFSVADRDRAPIQALALGLLAFGVLLRPNALAAAPILAAYVLWPWHFSLKRTAVLYLPAALGLFGLVHVVYYNVLGAKREHPLHSIVVFDLGGISHFAKDNVFPGSWTADETALITAGCYEPFEWNIYWNREPCKFVMARLVSDKVFGSRDLTYAWVAAILDHPVDYLQHRAAFMWTFLAGANLTMWTLPLDGTPRVAFADNPRLMALKALHDRLTPTPLFRAGSWLLLDIILCLFAWRRRDMPAGTFVLGVCGSAIVYIMSFFAVGVAPDFRYALWAVLAGMAGAVVLARRD